MKTQHLLALIPALMLIGSGLSTAQAGEKEDYVRNFKERTHFHDYLAVHLNGADFQRHKNYERRIDVDPASSYSSAVRDTLDFRFLGEIEALAARQQSIMKGEAPGDSITKLALDELKLIKQINRERSRLADLAQHTKIEHLLADASRDYTVAVEKLRRFDESGESESMLPVRYSRNPRDERKLIVGEILKALEVPTLYSQYLRHFWGAIEAQAAASSDTSGKFKMAPYHWAALSLLAAGSVGRLVLTDNTTFRQVLEMTTTLIAISATEGLGLWARARALREALKEVRVDETYSVTRSREVWKNFLKLARQSGAPGLDYTNLETLLRSAQCEFSLTTASTEELP